MRNAILVIAILFIGLNGSSQFSISSNNRFLLKNGQPFFWLGDTGWELFHRLSREEADAYLKRRSEQGFTVIQAVVLAEMDGLHKPNAEGQLPFLNDNPGTPNEKYFELVDYIIDKAASYNINIGLLPTWGDKVFKDKWGIGPEVFNIENAPQYAAWLAKRYKNRSNIIWILGGDRIPRGGQDIALWQAMGRAIMQATENKAIISFHPQPNSLGAGEWFHNDDWFAFNMFQTGHCRETAVYDRMQAGYNLKPTKPEIDAEPIYEDHPVCFNVKDLGTSNAFDVRRSAYLDLFAGAFGHTYGCHDIWQMYSPRQEPVNGPHHYWREALELAGANQMIFVKRLILSRPMLERIPDQSIISESNEVPAERVQATRGVDYLFVYTTAGKSFHVVLGKITGTQLHGFWFDPRTGKSAELGFLPNTGNKLFTPPSSGYGQDWILVLDDADRKYPLP